MKAYVLEKANELMNNRRIIKEQLERIDDMGVKEIVISVKASSKLYYLSVHEASFIMNYLKKGLEEKKKICNEEFEKL